MNLLRSIVYFRLISADINAQYCGCSSCTPEIWSQLATDADGSYACGDRIEWLQETLGFDEASACVKVSEEFADGPCGPFCNPEASECSILPPAPEFHCGCPTCTDGVWSGTEATDAGGTHSCGDRIDWLKGFLGLDEIDACAQVGGDEFPDVCGLCDPARCTGGTQDPIPAPTNAPNEQVYKCSCTSCTEQVWNELATDAAGTFSFLNRINWLQYERSYTEVDACALVSEEFPSLIGTACHPFQCDADTVSPSPTFQVTPIPSQVLQEDETVVSNGQSVLVVTNAVVDSSVSIGGTPRKSTLAVYLFTPDSSSGSICPQPTYEGSSWPLVLLSEGYQIDAGVDCISQALAGTDAQFLCCMSPDHGYMPMYQFIGDDSPHDINGEGLGGVWFSIPSVSVTPSPTVHDVTTLSPIAPPIDGTCPDVDTMPSCPVPNLIEDSDWSITESCVLDSGYYAFRKLIITNGSTLTVRPGADIEMNVAGGILVDDYAALFIGCEDTPFTGTFTVTFVGSRRDLTSGERWVKVGSATWANALVAASYSRLEVHGRPKISWTRLSKTASPGDTSLDLEDAVAWQPGDEIVVVQSSSERYEVETHTVASSDGNAVQLTEPLKEAHEGGFVGHGTRLNAEVGVLTHNVVFQSSFDLDACQNNFRWDGLPIDSEAAKNECFGGILTFLRQSIVHIEHAGFDRLGQALAMGRYPLHWHLSEDVAGSYVRNVAVHSSVNRCVTIHGSFEALVEGLVCFKNHGHNLYLEDGIEAGNAFSNNLVVNPVPSHTICTDRFGQESGPTGLWITNPNNTFVGNTVVGAAFGAWVTTPSGGSYNHDPYNTEQYTMYDPGYGGVFGASANYYNTAADYGPDHWVMNQEQARTPIRAFHQNSFKGSLRMAIAVDFRVYNSEDAYIPCSVASPYDESECPTCPNVGHTFTWGPLDFDAGLPVSERYYNPVKQEFNDIVIAHTPYNFNGREAFTVWTTGGTISLKSAIFYRNMVGSSLGHAGHCAGSLLGAGGTNLRLEDTVFIEGEAPFKLYDGGYFCYNCRWASLSFLVTMRPGSPGNVNGLILEKTAPLGWRDEDETDALFSWLWASEWNAAGKVQPKTSFVDNLVDFSSRFIQTSWEADYMAVNTVDGLYGTAFSLNGEFTQFIRTGNPNPTAWGQGVMVNPNANFRQFQPCRNGRGECADGRFCTNDMFEGRDIPNAPWI